MSFAEDDEILQDFLVEAGEILEKLSEQLVQLEKNPADRDLLNAIFRGFHTVKGGAGFLQIDAMVKCCHKTENLFDVLRNGKRSVDAELMDVTLQALDAVNQMFSDLQDGRTPQAAPSKLLDALAALAESGSSVVQAESPVADVVVESVVEENRSAAPVAETPESQENPAADITDDDFAAFVASLSDMPDSSAVGTKSSMKQSAPVDTPKSTLSSDEISDDEFEALLDSLHGKADTNSNVSKVIETDVPAKTASTVSANPESPKPKVEAPKAESVKPENKSNTIADKADPSNDLISDNEFESLLDQLQSKPTPYDKPKETLKASIAREVKPEPVKSVSAAPAPAAPIAKEKAPAATVPMASKEKSGKDEEGGDQKGSGLATENTVRVDTQRLDDIMNMVGELVLVRNRLVRLSNSSSDESMVKAIANLDVVTGDLQTSVMKTRMQPIKKVFGRFPRVVRDLARVLRKEVILDLVGEETDLDKNLVEALADPLVHLVRNAVDHGVELPEVREKSGKPRQGTVTLAAEQEGDHILLTITDDGAGMDPEKLRAKAVEKGILEQDAADRLSDSECFDLIFAPGFSTKTEISDVSGRGVGMDVVKTKITQLNGIVTIDSAVGRGSRICIKVPLTLAIMPTLMVMLGEQIFAFPLVSVSEIFNLDVRSTNVVDGQEVVLVRDKPIPLFHLKRWLVRSTGRHVSENSHVVVVSVGTQLVGFVVDQLIGQEEVVIKPLGKMLIGTPGVAGATITGDGTIALILDIPTLIRRYAGNHGEEFSEQKEHAA